MLHRCSRQAVAIAPNDPDVQANYAAVLAHAGHGDEGTAVFRQATDSNPKDPALWFGLGQELYGEGKTGQKPLPTFRRVSHSSPVSRRLCFGIARAYQDQKSDNGRQSARISRG